MDSLARIRRLAVFVRGGGLQRRWRKRALPRKLSAFASGHVAPTSREKTVNAEVLIPCYNHGAYLERAVGSIETVGLPVTIIDDASTDSTYEVASQVRENVNVPVRVLRNTQNIGQGASLNKAIRSSGANFFVVVNADDVALSGAVELIVATAAAHPQVRMIGGGSIWAHSSDALDLLADRLGVQSDETPPVRIWDPADVLQLNHYSEFNMTMTTCSFFRSAWDAVGGFWPAAERIVVHDDRDFQMRVGVLFPTAVIQRPLAVWSAGTSMGRGQS